MSEAHADQRVLLPAVDVLQVSVLLAAQLEQARDEAAAATSLRERAEQREAAAVQRAEQDLAAALARENNAHAREVNALTKALELAEARIAQSAPQQTAG